MADTCCTLASLFDMTDSLKVPVVHFLATSA
jgi:hypothetical protein